MVMVRKNRVLLLKLTVAFGLGFYVLVILLTSEIHDNNGDTESDRVGKGVSPYREKAADNKADSVEGESEWFTNVIFWSKRAEMTVPEGNSAAATAGFLSATGSLAVASVDPQPCGVSSRLNRVLRFTDGTRVCARYTPQDNPNVMAHDEIVTYHMSVLLGLDNVPVARLVQYNSTEPRWSTVAPALRAANWTDGAIVPVMQWVPGLDNNKSSVLLPEQFMSAMLEGKPVTPARLRPLLTPSEDPAAARHNISFWLQLSDMLVFDYVTSHFDRVVYNLMWDDNNKNADLKVTRSPIRNVLRTAEGKFWLFDNEYSALEGFTYLYSIGNSAQLTRLFWFHEKILRALCIFRRETVLAVERLAAEPDPANKVLEYVRTREPLYARLEATVYTPPRIKRMFHERLRDRLQYLLMWTKYCRMIT